jgi:hypothetical protein
MKCWPHYVGGHRVETCKQIRIGIEYNDGVTAFRQCVRDPTARA